MARLDGHDPVALERAAEQLRSGALVAFPTETVYGLGANADDAAAVGQIFVAKGRPADHPLIVHVCGAAQARHFCAEAGVNATRLMAHFWPGALTLILPRRSGVAEAAAGGQASIGLRAPDHPVAQALLRAAQARGVAGVAAPSANRFGRVSPTTADHVQQEFGDRLTIVDGGPCRIGIESTIVDCTRDERPTLLRPGMVGRQEIEAVLGMPLQARDGQTPRASGTLEQHYAPDASVLVMDLPELRAALERLDEAAAQRVAVYSRFTPSARGLAVSRRMPQTAAAVAQELFAVLRAFDDAGVAQIWVERPGVMPEWEGVNDRLRRAAAA